MGYPTAPNFLQADGDVGEAAGYFAILPLAASTPLTGSALASAVVGPFAPDLGRAVWLTLSGAWSGSAQLLRSIDGGATKLPLTVGGDVWASFVANCNEPVAEETVLGATYYLAITLASGVLNYRVSQ